MVSSKKQNIPGSPQKSRLKMWMVIPAYNEDKTIVKVLTELFDLNLNVVVVDDGSTDNTYQDALKIIKDHPERAYLYKHPLNRGLGASLKTGIEAALSENADIIITFDADGQHHPPDVMKVSRPIIEGQADVVIGKRDFKEMPLRKKLGNQIMNIITWIFYGVHVSDSQSGLRAFNRKAAHALDIESREYGVSSEIIREIKHKNLQVKEIPIQTIYTDYSLSKGTNTKVGLKILAKMIMEILK